MNPSDVILRPVLSEKAVMAMQDGKYTFYVHPSANRVQVKEAVMAVFDVDVTQVNLVKVRSKVRTQGRYSGRTPERLKAIVTLKPGQKIDQLEGLS